MKQKIEMEAKTNNWKVQILAVGIVAIFLAILLSFGPEYSSPQVTQNNQNNLAASGGYYPYLEDAAQYSSNPSSPTVESLPGSENNSVTPPGQSPIENAKLTAQVNSPAKFEVLQIGKNFTIKWKLDKAVPSVRLVVYEAAVSVCGYETPCLASAAPFVLNYPIADSVENDGEYIWQVGKIPASNSDLSPGKYLLRVESSDGQGLGDSFIFAIDPQNQSLAIDVAVPYSQDQLPYESDPFSYSRELDAPQSVIWESTPSIFFVDIFVRSRSCQSSCTLGSGLYEIARAIPNGKIIGWNPKQGDVNGAQLQAGEYELYVQDAANDSVKSQSKQFILE